MALGAVTGTLVGVAKIDSADFKALLDSVNVGASTAGAETTSIIVVPYGNDQACVWKYARASS